VTISPIAVLLLADDGDDVGGGDAVQVQVDLTRVLDRWPRRLWERLSGPRHPVEWRNHGSVELTRGAGRL
jgi:hypothetical protein